jgi:hypothetical protein
VKNFLIIFLFSIIGCDTHYKPNYQINSRRPPITVIAIDSITKSVIFRDADNHVFTIYNNPTTKAITTSLKVGDTVRLKLNNIITEKF